MLVIAAVMWLGVYAYSSNADRCIFEAGITRDSPARIRSEYRTFPPRLECTYLFGDGSRDTHAAGATGVVGWLSVVTGVTALGAFVLATVLAVRAYSHPPP